MGLKFLEEHKPPPDSAWTAQSQWSRENLHRPIWMTQPAMVQELQHILGSFFYELPSSLLDALEHMTSSDRGIGMMENEIKEIQDFLQTKQVVDRDGKVVTTLQTFRRYLRDNIEKVRNNYSVVFPKHPDDGKQENDDGSSVRGPSDYLAR